MDREVTFSSQLSSVSSTSSLPSLAFQSIADSVTPPEPSISALQPQEMPLTSRAETTTTMGTLSSVVVAAAPSTSRPHHPSPFQSFRSVRPLGPFHPWSRGSGGGQVHYFITAISFACLCSLRTTTAAASVDRPQQRQLEDEWTGEWNGEWTASQDDEYGYECGENCNDDNKQAKSGSMWIDSDVDGLAALTPDQIITYVSIGILSFMTLLCCVCYPEIMVVAFGKMCGCCGRGAGAGGKGVSGSGVEEEAVEGDYVGGMQEKEKKEKEKKKKRRKSKTKSSSRTRPSRDVELV